MTGRSFAYHFKVPSIEIFSLVLAIISRDAKTTSCPVFRIARVLQTMLVNACHQAFVLPFSNRVVSSVLENFEERSLLFLSATMQPVLIKLF